MTPGIAWLAVTGDLVAAEATTARPGSLEVADVIWRHSGSRPLAWLAETLNHYPGCAVAASGQLTASRAGHILVFDQNEPGFNPLVCAVFVHSWLAAGWPLWALDPSRLVVVSGILSSVTHLSFYMFYTGSPPGSSSPSRRRSSPASGASMLE